MLHGKRALITGSTSGIGLGIARALAAQGCHVVINGLADASVSAALETELAATGVEVTFDGANLASPAEIERLMTRCAELGGLDILVNNAGIQFTSPIETFPTERWDAVLGLNLSAAFHTIRLSLSAMKARGWGRIINIASAHGLVASVDKAAYVAAKHGLVGLTKVVALETAQTGVTCNAICPGWVLTPLVQKQIDTRVNQLGLSPAAASAALLGEKQPSQAFVTPEQIGSLVVFLCSPGAEQVRGAAWAMDGGWTAQ